MNPELLKAIDPIVRKVGLYSAYTLDESEYVGHTSDPYAKRMLHTDGYEQSPRFLGIRLQAAKLHPKSGRVHDWSMRKIDPENNRKQFHIHGWVDPSEQVHMVYSHRELRPDVCRVAGETIGEAIERLQDHYRPSYGENYEQGVMCDALRELVE